jgi:signal transduction histidine kinase
LTIQSRALPSVQNPGHASHVLVRFRDTGVGMTTEQRLKLFGSLLSTTKPRGTGLGMAIVSRVVEAHQGSIRVRSRPGIGTSLTVILPVDAPLGSAPKSPSASDAQ